ncbi:hypothetical protein RSOLAG1IB_08925 [Rhizoctonia solani AG-1 IB]|uniref:Uncharacterized protein n=1 Tax=Thanatephorus cucumeris (strain AG1-IB / isolate 7/3/14) TaxID=1108050 RepID=M5BZZ4_THACB|nr:hypothetical protein BN14_06797 [Rhizoctonia solani AG-1 IB]CEL58905.1 hypothetical protein RSOLAG1IB_08925 [Rhizoctonia solani AG-1 IB]
MVDKLIPLEIQKLLRDKEKVETISFRPQNGDDSRGLFVGQYSKFLGGQTGDYGVYEYVDVYLDEVRWRLVKHEANRNPTGNLEITFKESIGNTVTEGRETTISTEMGFEKLAKFSMSIEDKRISTTSTSNEKGTERKHTLTPGQAAYVYKRVYKFNLRAWWVADLSHHERIVTQDATNNTHEAAVARTIDGDDEIFFSSLTGSETIRLPPTKKEKEDSPSGGMLRVRFSDLYNKAKAVVAGAWKRALGGSELDVKKEMLQHKEPGIEFIGLPIHTVDLDFLALMKYGIKYPPPV